MATAAQIVANRANAQLSSGPKTEAGKAASSRNATTHGLSSATFALLPNEDPSAFAELLQSLKDEFQPAGGHEEFLIETMAKARWRILRIERLEGEAFDDLFTDPDAPAGSPESQLLRALKPASNILDKLHRYSAAAERSYHKALRELRAGRDRKTSVQNEANRLIVECLFDPKPPLQNEPNPPRQNEPKPVVQNEPKSRFTTNAYGLGNPALRL